MSKKIFLITGSQGFIGSNLLPLLTSKNEIITVNIGYDKKQKNIKSINKNIETLSPKDIPGHLDGIIHLAAITDVDYCNNYPKKCFQTNVLGTLNILEIARKKDCKLLFVSTSHVFGIPIKLPIKEDHPKKPLSIYAASKLAGEIGCEGFAKSYGMDVSIARLFSVYGINSPSHLVTSRIISQLKKNIVTLGNLSSKRDFIYIDDVTSAILTIFNKSKKFNDYNVGTGKSHSILELCKILKDLSNSNASIKSINTFSRKNDVFEIRTNSSKLRKLGWIPKIKLKKGLEITLKKV